MDDPLFWRIIGEAYQPDLLENATGLHAALEVLPWFEVVDFQAKFEALVATADTQDLRAAAFVVNGDASERGFRDFRLGLAASGRGAYEAALQNADALADFLDGDPVDGFGLDKVAVRVYESKTGMSDFYQRLAERHADLPTAPTKSEVWVPPDEAELRRRLPNLRVLYPTDEAEPNT